MPALRPNRARRQRQADLLVENRLAPGRWRFRLVAVDEAGNESKPAELVVTVRERGDDGGSDGGDGGGGRVRPAPDTDRLRVNPDVPRPVRPVRPLRPAADVTTRTDAAGRLRRTPDPGPDDDPPSGGGRRRIRRPR